MGTGPRQIQTLATHFVDEQPIRFDMTVAITLPVARQAVIVKTIRQRPLSTQKLDYRIKLCQFSPRLPASLESFRKRREGTTISTAYSRMSRKSSSKEV